MSSLRGIFAHVGCVRGTEALHLPPSTLTVSVLGKYRLRPGAKEKDSCCDRHVCVRLPFSLVATTYSPFSVELTTDEYYENSSESSYTSPSPPSTHRSIVQGQQRKAA
ncbi:hypothetical protein K431DRAFT_65255 [Polychaeton citri CBS 116435]|uniref:Uncharacterized protein n=1 Tax=Polychaeton citri CBS 116435 TaxID=1314669 RepID=A0A9P4UN19_9PEZI|nr:hypothetical protein K431DRAFT_65255 [Polychaeton citri CBS 116435]